MLRQARRHRKRHGDNLFASLLAREVADGSRIVVRGELFTAFVPFAARWPVEVHIYPNRLVRNLTELNDGELDEFARIYLDVLQRFDRMYSSPLPYMSRCTSSARSSAMATFTSSSCRSGAAPPN